MNHKLALEIPDTLNTKIFRVEDYSDYNEDVPVKCQKLEIIVPGFIEPIVINKLEVGFNLNLTACDLGIQKIDCDKKQLCLPDGVYAIKYSVSPNSQVYVEYNYLRISKLMSKYREILCSIDFSEEPEEDIKEQIKLLHEARIYIEAAKAKVEVCHNPSQGMELYEYAKKLLEKFNCNNC